ncbi:hypothetical protein [Halosimplex marinum]|uniref:hypothetical protein n=1 Tax=Halosimplex marinum TaxID=3396620 RepID=UPI003F55DFA3
MNLSRSAVVPARVGLFVAAVFVGIGIGTLVPPDPVTVPGVGSVSGLLVGGGALVAGGGLYAATKRSSSGCGCGGDCDC